MADLYYIEEGYYDAGYFNYTASIDLVAFSNSSVTTVAGKIVDVNDAYPYTWDDLTTWENFVSNRWGPQGVFVASAFTLTGDITLLTGVDIFATGSFSSQASLSATIERFAGVVSALFSVVSQSTTGSRTATASIELSSSFTQTATISHIGGADLFAFTEAAIAVQVDRIRGNNIAATSVFNIATDATRIQQGDADADAIFSAIINGLRSRDVNLETQAAFSFVCDATEIEPVLVQFNCSMQSEFTVDTTARQIRDAHLTGTGVAVISCVAVKTAQVSSTQTSQFTQTALAGTLEIVSANMSFFASVFVSRNAYNRTRIELEYTPITQTLAKFGTSSAQVNSVGQVRTLNYPNQVRAYIGDQFVVQGWYYHTYSLSNAVLMYCGAGTGISDTSVGDNQWAVNFAVRNLNNTTLIKYQLLTRNSSNQTVKFDSAEFQLSSYMGAPWTQGPSFNPVTNNQWNNFAVTKDASNLISFKINGTTVVSGTISTLGTASQYRIGFRRVSDYISTVYWDELSYRKDTSAVDLNLLTNDVDKQVFLFHLEEYETQIPIDDNSLPIINHSGNAGLTSQFSLLGKLTGITNASATLQSSAILTATISHIEGADLFAFGNATLTASIDKIKESASAISAQASQSADISITRQGVADVQSTADISATALRTKQLSSDLTTEAFTVTVAFETQDFIADLSSEFVTDAAVNYIPFIDAAFAVTSTLTVSIRTDVFVAMVVSSSAAVVAEVVKTTDVTVLQVNESTLTLTAVKITDILANPIAEFTVFCNAVTAAEISLVAFSNANVSVTISPLRSFTAEVSCQSTLVANTADSLNKIGSANISSEFTVLATATFIVENVIAIQAIASNLTAVVKSVAVDIPLDCNCTISADVSRIRSSQLTASAISAVSITLSKITGVDSAITSAFTQTTTAGKLVNANITTQTIASNLTAVVRIAGLFIISNVVSTLTASGVVRRGAQSAFISTATISVTAVKRSVGSAVIISQVTVSATIGLRKQFASAVTSALTFVVAIRDLRLDEIVYVIPGENYVYEIISESRLHDIYGETRIRSVLGESRNRRITGESRIHIID